jgi:hypothetical protein
MRVVLLTCLLSLSALAQSGARVESPRGARLPVQRLDFTGPQAIEGTRERPVMTWQSVPERKVFRRLLHVRASFANELANSADAL